jgi:dTDP-4-dehydrorhamnose reductase
MRILLLGGTGQVGHALRHRLAPLGELVVTTRDGRLADGSDCEALDLGEPERIAPLVGRIGPDVVVNATAYTAVDRAESERGLAMRINAEAPGQLARACARLGATLVHYSTDYVFDGTATEPYREDHPTAPLGAYGESKLAGEQAIGTSGARYLILRTAWVYGLHGHNFLRTMLRVGAERDELRVVADQVGSPTPAWLIADVTRRLLAQGTGMPEGVRHLVADGATSWHGFAEAIFEDASARGWLPRPPRVMPISTTDYPTPARRPAYSVLDTALLRADLGTPLPHWRQALSLTLAEAAPAN